MTTVYDVKTPAKTDLQVVTFLPASISKELQQLSNIYNKPAYYSSFFSD